ncbi:MAG: HlyD family type I secretion periplasmic adaptor subunit [Pontibacterium sp.]
MTELKAEQESETVAIKDDKPWLITGFVTLLVTFVLLLGWAALAPLQSAVVTSGQISVASLNKTVQHLDGGLVDRIEVKDGDLVEAGQLLLSLHRSPLEIESGRIRGQLLEVQANLERLEAERKGERRLLFSPAVQQEAGLSSNQEILTTQLQLFSLRGQSLNAERDVLEQRIVQSERQIEGLQVLLLTLEQRRDLLTEDLNATAKLASRKMASQSQLRDRQGRKAEIEGEIAEQKTEIERLRQAIGETRYQISLQLVQYRTEVITRERDFQAQLIRLKAEQRRVEDKLSRVDIRSPVSGKVKGFEVVTRGAVIGAGKPVMEIVPLDKLFRIDVQVSPMDIDSLSPGLKAEVRLPVFAAVQQFPALWADLQDVSTDTYDGQGPNNRYYKAHLVLDEKSTAALEALGLTLVSGMPADLYIKTGERTLLDYLVKPLKAMLAGSLNET